MDKSERTTMRMTPRRFSWPDASAICGMNNMARSSSVGCPLSVVRCRLSVVRCRLSAVGACGGRTADKALHVLDQSRLPGLQGLRVPNAQGDLQGFEVIDRAQAPGSATDVRGDGRAARRVDREPVL